MADTAYHVLLYDLVDDHAQRRGPYREEHLGLLRQAHDRGEVLMAGALADPMDGAVMVFRTGDPAVVEAFVRSDPYVRAGLVTRWRVRPWTVVVGG